MWSQNVQRQLEPMGNDLATDKHYVLSVSVTTPLPLFQFF